MLDEPIGSVSVQIVADYSRMSAGLAAAEAQAKTAGSKIASSFSQAATDTSSLETTVSAVVLAINRLNATLSTNANLHSAAAGAVRAHSAALRGQVSEIQATSGAIRVLEGHSALRATERFIATVLGLGPALQAIFPIIGAIAFAEILVRIGQEVSQWYKATRDAVANIDESFHGLNLSITTTNDELALTAAKLSNQIAKLENKPENALAEALAEDRVQADRLALALEKDLEAFKNLIKERGVGVSGLLLGIAPTTGAEESVTAFKRKISSIDEQLRVSAGDPNAQKALIAERYQKYENEISRQTDILNDFLGMQAERTKRLAAAQKVGGAAGAAVQLIDPSQIANIRVQEGIINGLRSQQQHMDESATVAGLKRKKDELEAIKEGNAAAKRAAEEWLSGQRDLLEDTKMQHAMSADEEERFWTRILPQAEASYPSVVRNIQREILSSRQKGFAELRSQNEADLKAFEDVVKAARAAAEEAEKSPAAAEAATRRAAVAKPSDFGLRPEMAAKAAEPLPGLDARAAHDALESLKRGITEIDDEWKSVGQHSALEEKQAAAAWIAFLEQLRGMFPGIDTLIDSQTKKWIAAEKRVVEEAAKAGAITRNTDADNEEATIAQRKLAIEQAYGLQVIKTTQNQIAYTRTIGALDEANLQIKLRTAQLALEEALDTEDAAKIAEAHRNVQKEQLAIDMERQKTAGKIADITKTASFSGLVDSGLLRTAEGAVGRLSSGIAGMITQTKNWGQEFRNILRDIEKQIIETFATAALKRGLDALLGVIQTHVGGGTAKKLPGGGVAGGGVLGTNVGAAGGLGGVLMGGAGVNENRRLQVDLQNIKVMMQLDMDIRRLSNAIENSATISAQGSQITQNLSGVTTAHTDKMLDNITKLGANTGALGGNTTATIENTITMIAIAVVNWVTGRAGGGPIRPGTPYIVGERGPELVIPDSAGKVIPADQTRAMLQSMQMPMAFSLAAPGVPSGTFGGAAGAASMIAKAGIVTNQNTGRVGNSYYNIYNANNPREVMRQISDFEKRQTGKYSPANS